MHGFYSFRRVFRNIAETENGEYFETATIAARRYGLGLRNCLNAG